jgi:tetratricopeptide (TPR) repeat protein
MALFAIIIAGLALLLLLWKIGKLSRGAMWLVGAALALGLVGYSVQGQPNLAASPVAPKADLPPAPGEDAQARGEFIGKVGAEADTLAQADSYFRIGRPELAARVIRLGLEKNQNSPGLWTGLGNAMVAHGQGRLSPPADYAYRKALKITPGYPGALYFYAVALAQNGRVDEARPLFSQLLASIPADAPIRRALTQELERNGVLTPADAGAAPPAK